MRHSALQIIALLLCCVLSISAEYKQQKRASVPKKKTSQPTKPKIKTEVGDIIVLGTQESDRFPPDCKKPPSPGCDKALEGYTILIIWLKSISGSKVDEVATYLTHHFGEISIVSDSGEKTNGSFGGMLDKKLFIAFTPAKSEHNFKLSWPDNPQIDIGK